jgi:hypothetical protein
VQALDINTAATIILPFGNHVLGASSPVDRRSDHMDANGRLCLNVKVGEEVVIGGAIRLIVKTIRRRSATLLFIAPRTIRVDRRAVHDARNRKSA